MRDLSTRAHVARSWTETSRRRWDGGRFGGNDFFSTSWFDDKQSELS